MFAFYIIGENANDPSYPYLPKEPYDIPLGLQALTAGVDANNNVIQFPVVNGVDSPYLNVEPRWYRFRMLNASATQSISLEMCGGAGQRINNIWEIGTDGGMLKNPLNISDRPLTVYQDGRLDIYQAVGSYLNKDLCNRGDVASYVTSRTASGKLGMKTGGGVFSYTPEKIAQLRQERARKLVAVRKALDS